MSTVISQRELRNDNADIMRRVEAGETFTVTRNGRPVASLVPVEDLPPGTRRMTGRELRDAWDSLGITYDAEAWMRDIREAQSHLIDDPFDDPWTRRTNDK